MNDIQKIETTAKTDTEEQRLEILHKLDSVLDNEIILNNYFRYKRKLNNWIRVELF